MKFGKKLRNSMISEWKLYYINYQLLKQLIKKITKGTSSTHEFCATLDDELKKATQFYSAQFEWCCTFGQDLSDQMDSYRCVDQPHADDLIRHISLKKSLSEFLREIDLMRQVNSKYPVHPNQLTCHLVPRYPTNVPVQNHKEIRETRAKPERSSSEAALPLQSDVRLAVSTAPTPPLGPILPETTETSRY